MIVYDHKMIDRGMEVMLKWEDGEMHDLPQDYADMVGWDELGKKVWDFYDGLARFHPARRPWSTESFTEPQRPWIISGPTTPIPRYIASTMHLWSGSQGIPKWNTSSTSGIRTG